MAPGPIPHVLFLPELFPAPHPCLEPRRKESWDRRKVGAGGVRGQELLRQPTFLLPRIINWLE